MEEGRRGGMDEQTVGRTVQQSTRSTTADNEKFANALTYV